MHPVDGAGRLQHWRQIPRRKHSRYTSLGTYEVSGLLSFIVSIHIVIPFTNQFQNPFIIYMAKKVVESYKNVKYCRTYCRKIAEYIEKGAP